jgi:tripartite-type tricarboxylate transporter receptor subunit TctC
LQSMPAVLPLAKDKRIKVIAMTGLTRSPLLSDVPTLAESVMPGFEISTWNGVMAPARTPATIIRRLNAEIVKALQDVDMKQRLEQESATASSSSPEEYGAYLRSELARWSKVVKTTGVKLE